jgi:hypothetical protein
LFGCESVVRATEESKVVGHRRATAAEGLSMIVLEPGARLATATGCVGPGALDAVALGDVAAGCVGDVAAFR